MDMSVKFVNMREFRHNMAGISREARKKNQRIVILKRNLPIFELTPIIGDEEGLYKEEFVHGLLESLKQAGRGKMSSLKEAKKDLGL